MAGIRFLCGRFWRSTLARSMGGTMLLWCASVAWAPLNSAQALTREVYDCGDPFGDTDCHLDDSSGGHIYGRSEGELPRGPNPNHLVFANGRDVFGSTDVDMLYDLVGDIHPYFSAKYGRDGPNSLGGTGNGSSVPSDVYRVLAHVDGWVIGPSACGSAVNAFSGSGLVAACMGSTQTDLIGHELAHSLMEFMRQNPDDSWVSLGTMNEPGTLNESMADFFGESVERYLTGSNDWLMALYPDGVTSLRNMADPPAQLVGGVLVGDRYLSPRFYSGPADFGGVHYNAGILNKASYLAVAGGSFNGFEITGIGFDKVEQIWYRAITQYFEPDETFNEAYDDLIQAATDWYGPEDVWEVTKALRSVEMHLSRDGLRGDFNLDGFVDAADWVMVQKQLGKYYTLGAIEDVRTHFGNSLAGGGQDVSVPEPGVAVLVLIAAACIGVGRRPSIVGTHRVP